MFDAVPEGLNVARLLTPGSDIDPQSAYQMLVDAGKVIQPDLLMGQAQGGIAMGIGYALLENLPPREKKILLLRFFRGMTQSQIAAEIGVSQMHVSRLLNRTLEQLRESITAAS